jgi:hypothetical protein
MDVIEVLPIGYLFLSPLWTEEIFLSFLGLNEMLMFLDLFYTESLHWVHLWPHGVTKLTTLPKLGLQGGDSTFLSHL